MHEGLHTRINPVRIAEAQLTKCKDLRGVGNRSLKLSNSLPCPRDHGLRKVTGSSEAPQIRHA